MQYMASVIHKQPVDASTSSGIAFPFLSLNERDVYRRTALRSYNGRQPKTTLKRRYAFDGSAGCAHTAFPLSFFFSPWPYTPVAKTYSMAVSARCVV